MDEIKRTSSDPMNKAEYEIMYRIEDSYWWYRGIREIARVAIESAVAPNGSLKVLDAGCGTGGNLPMLEKFGKVHGVELSREARQFLKRREFSRYATSTISALPYRDASFDLVTSFYVNEYLEDDLPAYREYYRVLKPGGILFNAEVAFEALRGEHDLAVGLLHRYTKPELTGKLKTVGFDVLKSSYINSILAPPIFALRAFRRTFHKVEEKADASSDFDLAPGPLHGLFYATLAIEARLIKFMSLPFGVSVFGLARKPL